MRTIQKYLPNPRNVETMRIFVNAKPDVAWETARHFDLSTVSWVRWLFDLRTLPDFLAGKQSKDEDRRIGVDQIVAQGKGFILLEEVPGTEVVIGAVGKFWHLNIPFKTVTPAEFKDFDAPGWGKLAWAIRVEPFAAGSTISLELRTTATEEDSWQRLSRYFMVIGPFSHLIRESGMAHFEAQLGKMERPSDTTRALPGDKRIADTKYHITHQIDIEAPPSLVWRYLMQLGCDRAGWYSIDLLDHGGVPSIDYLVEGWETRQIGDHLAATPAQDSFFEVYEVEHEHYFLIGGETARLNGAFKMTWAFVLEPIGTDATHLVVRARMESTPPWAEWFMGNVLYPPIHSLMQGAQLRNLKRIAERDALVRTVSELAMLEV